MFCLHAWLYIIWEQGIKSSETGVADSYKPLEKWYELHSGIQEEQPVLSTQEPSL